MKRLLFSSCLLVILTLSHDDLRWSQPTVALDEPTVQGTQSPGQVPVKLPIRLYWSYLVIVEGSIGSVQKLNFLVGTGAYPSVVDQKIASSLGLAKQPGRVNLSNKSVQTRLVVLPSLSTWSRPNPCRVSSGSDRRPLVLAESNRPQGGWDHGSGCPQEKQFHHQLSNQGNTLRPSRAPPLLLSFRDRYTCSDNSDDVPRPETPPGSGHRRSRPDAVPESAVRFHRLAGARDRKRCRREWNISA